MNNTVYALAVIGTDLFVGGNFTTAGGDSASRIAKWSDSGGWSALGSGLNGGVNALAVIGTDLYAGGLFTTAGGDSANCIAKWSTPGGWSALGSGMNHFVNALAVNGTDLYAGGVFTTAGGDSANRIARWSASGGWSALGSGVDNDVYALAVNGTDLYAGGVFATAGGKPSVAIGKWYMAGVVGVTGTLTEIPEGYALKQNYPNPFNPTTTISFGLPSRSFVSLIVFDALGREVSRLVSEALSAGTYSVQWNAEGLASGVYFYRLQAGSLSETKKLILLR